ncbi:MAG: 3-deoxy-7-phosphoheptulonate synthase [Bacillota bacterium]|nr:3-deoxy-7-phosphoheptulonate synthase [Bacillota bacterium]
MMHPFIIPVREVRVGNADLGTVGFGGAHPFAVISGPCSVESAESIVTIAQAVRTAGAVMLRGGAYKPRTRAGSFQGLGQKALDYLLEAKRLTGLPVVTEVIEIAQIDAIARVADLIQIGARNMYNYPLLREVGKLGLPVLLKRGLSATIDEWIGSYEYIGHDRVIFCERGVRGFDPSTRNLLDLTSVPIVQKRTGLPVIVDPSHGTGRRDLVAPLTFAAEAVGANGVMIEAHVCPDDSISDADQTISIEQLEQIIHHIRR